MALMPATYGYFPQVITIAEFLQPYIDSVKWKKIEIGGLNPIKRTGHSACMYKHRMVCLFYNIISYNVRLFLAVIPGEMKF